MSFCGEGKLVTFELQDHRLITLDLDTEDDWGDIRVTKDYETKEIYIDIGNDCDGWVKAIRFFEELERDDTEDENGNIVNYTQYKFQTFGEVDLMDVVEWVLVRELCFCEGETLSGLQEILSDYGIDINKIYIPDYIREYATEN